MTNTSIGGQPDTDPGPVPQTEPEQDWIFTFGHGQRLYSFGHARPHTGEPVGVGVPLMDRYVVIRGTWTGARDTMMRTFGPIWSMQYASREAAGVPEYELTELILTTDPGVAW